MLTRREKLLNRPWQLRRYNHHRHKVLTALPAIDFGPPAERNHVTCKLKKLQWEGERRHKIEEENFKLLQRMGSIMKKNRLANHWQTPPPNFLHRVGIYPRTRSPTPFQESSSSTPSAILPKSVKKRSCSACTPSQAKPTIIPEERVPWAPPKERLSRRNSGSVSREPQSDFPCSLKPKSGLPTLPTKTNIEKKPLRSKSLSASMYKSVEMAAPNRLELTQGSLKVRVNFPPQAEVIVISGNEKKIIQMNKCQCSAIAVSRKK